MCGLFCALFSCSKYFNVSVISCDHYNNHPSRAVTWAQGSEAELRLELRSFTYGSAGWRFLWLRWPQSYLYLLASTVFWEEVWLPWARGSVGVWSQQFAACPFFSSRFSWSSPSSATIFLPIIDSGSPGMTSLFSPAFPETSSLCDCHCWLCGHLMPSEDRVPVGMFTILQKALRSAPAPVLSLLIPRTRIDSWIVEEAS